MSGDDAAEMEAFFRKTEEAVRRTASRLGFVLGLGAPLVEDAIQGAYEIAFRKWDVLHRDERFRQRPDGFLGWICVTAHNRVLTEYKHWRKLTELDDELDLPDPNLDVEADVVNRAEHHECLRHLQQALRAAPESVAEIIALFLAAEGSQADRLKVVAAGLEITHDAARKRFTRSIETLQKLMEQMCGDTGGRSHGYE